MFAEKWLWPRPQEVVQQGFFERPPVVRLTGVPCPPQVVKDFWEIGKVKFDARADVYSIDLKVDAAVARPQGYELTLAASGCVVVGADEPGLWYGLQTLLQILASRGASGEWPGLVIRDWPAYKTRCFMVDMGRSVFPLLLLKRIVRILARLKMNQLHLHLYDDELCGLRFDGLPFGSENPNALSLDDLGELVRYAADYHVEIVPELEAWGHVGSLVYHREGLRGGPGMYNGSSFLVGEGMFDLMRELVGQVVAVMPDKGVVHLGLDEANWFPAPTLPKDFTPEDMVSRYHNMLQDIAAQQNKQMTLRLWADHGGRPVPQAIQEDVIIEPWQYWDTNAAAIDKAISRYSGEGKMRWMMGAGQSGGQFRGAYHATRYWCRSAVESPNVEGVNITLWCSNDLDQKMISLFAGALYAWNPFPATSLPEDYETFDRHVFPIMQWWQGMFRDAFPDAIENERGPIVYNGFYLWGDKHGQPAAPTAPIADTWTGHDYANE